jgi:hypothetical protein
VILYAVKRWLSISPDEWQALSWDLQQTYLDGLSEDEEIPFRMQADAGRRFRPGPGTREGVDAGVKVIDLTAMREELETLRRQQAAG